MKQAGFTLLELMIAIAEPVNPIV
ncbi:prepilin-type N-terminal cleavage/methylation domain-containing protein [Aeromonas salmonicida]